MNEERDDFASFFSLSLPNKMGLHYCAEEGTPSVINYMKEQQAKLERGWSDRLTLWPLLLWYRNFIIQLIYFDVLDLLHSICTHGRM